MTDLVPALLQPITVPLALQHAPEVARQAGDPLHHLVDARLTELTGEIGDRAASTRIDADALGSRDAASLTPHRYARVFVRQEDQRDNDASSVEVAHTMSILRLTAVLEDVAPRVARTLMVPSNLHLDRLHLVLQAAMGWENRHLYSFAAGSCRWSGADPDLGLDSLPASKANLQEALAAAESGPLVYTYDFGNDWRHCLSAELTDGPLPGQLYPRLVEAEGKCPPEDVGGPPGYAHFLEALASPEHPDHEELTEWHGGPFDPSVPDIDTHQLEILKLAKRWTPRKR